MSMLCDRYAQVFLELSGGYEALHQAAEALYANQALWQALTSPVVHEEEKTRVLRRLFDREDEATLSSFLTLLARRGRMELLPRIAEACRRLELEQAGGALGVMTCVRVPAAEEQEAICKMLCKQHRLSRAALEVRVDPALLGGFTLELQGVTYDKSVRGGLDALARRLQEREAT